MQVPASMSLVQASDPLWDVAVVGAGPAGAMAAFLLARAGRKVLLLDQAQFPRAKVCGGCLNGRALASLKLAGLQTRIAKLQGEPLRAVRMYCGGQGAEVALPDGLALSRYALDAELIRAAIDAGAAFLPGVSATLGESTGAARGLRARAGPMAAELRARVVLAADGLRCGLLHGASAVEGRSRIGAGATLGGSSKDYPPGTIVLACGRDGYVGLTRVEAGQLNVAAALDPAAVRAAGGLGQASAALLVANGLPVPGGWVEAAWLGTPALTRTTHPLAADRVLVLGDAAGYVEPFTGEGMAWALSAAAAVVPFALRACERWQGAIADAWTRAYEQDVRSTQAPCRLIAAALRRPWLTRLAIQTAAHAPALANAVVRRLHRSASGSP